MKGQPDVDSPEAYLAALDEPRRTELGRIHAFVREAAPELEPYIQSGMIGYGRFAYRYDSGRSGEWCRVGLASNKAYVSLYVTATEGGAYVAEAFKDRLPRASIGKSCIRFKRFDDLDPAAVRELLRAAVRAAAPPAATRSVGVTPRRGSGRAAGGGDSGPRPRRPRSTAG